MRATIHRLVEAKRLEREESGEAGFSLIELIVVVVILGILAAVAIPIFLNIQGQARQNALNTVAANAASQVSAALAQNQTPSVANLETGSGSTNKPQYTITVTPATGATTDNFCVTATDNTNSSLTTATSGPGCGSGSTPSS